MKTPTDFPTAWHVQINITTRCATYLLSLQTQKTFPRLEITSTSEGRNLKNLATSTTTERNIPEVICKVRLAGGRDHRQKPSEVFLINGARPGQASESDSGPIHCKHSLMEGSNPGTHMNGWRQTHTYERLNVHTPGHTPVCLLSVYIPCCLPWCRPVLLSGSAVSPLVSGSHIKSSVEK